MRSRSSRGRPEEILAETKKITQMLERLEFDHLKDTEELAIELHYIYGFHSKAIIDSEAVTESRMNKATKHFLSRRFGAMGRPNTAFFDEQVKLYEWINLKILMHEAPTIAEIQAKVWSFSLLFIHMFFR